MSVVAILPQMDAPQPSKEEITGDTSLLSLQYTEQTQLGQNVRIKIRYLYHCNVRASKVAGMLRTYFKSGEVSGRTPVMFRKK